MLSDSVQVGAPTAGVSALLIAQEVRPPPAPQISLAKRNAKAQGLIPKTYLPAVDTAASLAGKLTIIFTTSPVKSNPSINLLQEVAGSLSLCAGACFVFAYV